MRIPKTKTPALLALTTALAIGLSACGGETTPKDVYDFTGPSAQSTSQVVVEVPQELIDVNGDYAKNRFIERVTVRPLEIESAEWCAMTWDYELLGDPITAHYDKLKENNIDWMTADISDDQWREIALDLEPQLTEADLKQIVEGTHPMYSHDRLRKAAAGRAPVHTDEELHQMAVRDTLSVTNPELSEPDLDDPSRGFYYSEDDNVATVIDRCAASVNVDETDFEINFNSYNGSLGEVPIGVMRDGTVFASGGEVNDWQLDSNGDWVKK